MEIKSIEIKYYHFAKFRALTVDGVTHVKELPFLSVVQSTVGSYDITLDKGEKRNTGEGGFFIAPSGVTQTITHRAKKLTSEFAARYIFIDATVNGKYRLDSIFCFPVTADTELSSKLNSVMDRYELSDNICDRMCCIYTLIKYLLQYSVPKAIDTNPRLTRLTDYVSENYANRITVNMMAKIMQMSESNLYSVFKKSIGMSPVKYLNEYRLSEACALLLKTDLSIRSIAEAVGIYDQFYFCRLFKAKYLCSPVQYRKLYSDICTADDTKILDLGHIEK